MDASTPGTESMPRARDHGPFRVRRSAAASLAALLAMLLACEIVRSPTTPDGDSDIATIEVAAPDSSMAIGEALQLTAVARNASGDPIAGVVFEWTSADTTIASVDPSGRVDAVGAGPVDIAATAGGRQGGLTVAVLAQVAATVDRTELPAAAEAAIHEILSAGDSVAMDADSALRVSADAHGALVVALDAEGAPFLAVFSDTAGVMLNAERVASALVRFALDPLSTRSVPPAELAAAIRSAPSFAALHDRVRQAMEAGLSPLASAEIDRDAARVALELRQAASAAPSTAQVPAVRESAAWAPTSTTRPAPGPGSATPTPAATQSAPLDTIAPPGPHDFIDGALYGENLWLEDVSGPGIALRNGTRLYWHVTARDTAGAELDSRESEWMPFDFFEFIPYQNPPTITEVLGTSTAFTVTVEQTSATRTRHVAELARRALLAAFDVAGIFDGLDRATACAYTVGQALVDHGLFGPVVSLAGGDAAWAAFAESAAGVFDDEFLFASLAQDCGVSLASRRLLAAVGKTAIRRWVTGLQHITTIGVVANLSSTFELGYQTFEYWDFEAAARVCKGKGVIAPCVDRIEVAPAETSVTPGGATRLTATAFDAEGADITDSYSIEWSSSDSSVATVDAAGLVRGNAEGTATIAARAGGREATATIAVRAAPDLNGDWRLETYRGLWMGSLCGPAKGCGDPGFVVDSGRTTIADGWITMSIWATYPDSPYPGSKVIAGTSGSIEYAGVADTTTYQPNGCTAEGNVPNFAYCTALPPGHLFLFWNDYITVKVPWISVPEDGSGTMKSVFGGATVWRKEYE